MIDKTDKMKRRWMKVIQNKEKLQLDTQRHLKMKFDKLSKLEKSKKKKLQGEIEDRKIIIERHHEKFSTVRKRRDLLKDEFEKGLKKKEEHFKERMHKLEETR